MRYWYAYTGSNLLFMHGRAVRRVISSPQVVQPLLETVQRHYARYKDSAARPVPSPVFIAAMMAPLAAQELGIEAGEATVFSSVRQVFALFEEEDARQIAIHLLNGKTASGYADAQSAEAIAAQIARGFASGELLALPHDGARLQAPQTLRELPGVAAFLLAHAQAESKAFADYLRHGTPPLIPPQTARAIASARSVQKTWEREARLAREYRSGDRA